MLKEPVVEVCKERSETLRLNLIKNYCKISERNIKEGLRKRRQIGRIKMMIRIGKIFKKVSAIISTVIFFYCSTMNFQTLLRMLVRKPIHYPPTGSNFRENGCC